MRLLDWWHLYDRPYPRRQRCDHEYREESERTVVAGRAAILTRGTCTKCGLAETTRAEWASPEPEPEEWVEVRFTRREYDAVLRNLPRWGSGSNDVTDIAAARERLTAARRLTLHAQVHP